MSGTRRRGSLGFVPRMATVAAVLVFAPAAKPGGVAPGTALPPDTTRAALYDRACAACHGSDGSGRPEAQVGFAVPLPDFADCDFAAREPDPDWFAIIHEGGPVRGFDEMMPAFGEALTDDEIRRVLVYVRTLCTDHRWPRGELNLPRPFVTEKAYPEDEAVITTTVAAEGTGAVMNELLWEQRFGPRSQIELSLPVGLRDTGGPDGWEAGVGDLGIGVKHTLFHSVDLGSIFSVGGEVVLPIGNEPQGFGKGTTVFEPFLAIGQMLPGESFVHLQVLAEFPADRDVEDEVAWRAAVGRTWTTGQFGRAWTPMMEVLGGRELEGGSDTNWDILPQVQVTLNARQHVMANVGVRVPLTNTDARNTQLLFYLLWDWFDGGLLEGW